MKVRKITAIESKPQSIQASSGWGLNWLEPFKAGFIQVCLHLLKDVRTHWYCASLQRMQIHMPRHAVNVCVKY